MYSLRHLTGIAREGFADMAPAVEQALNGSRGDDRLDRLFGTNPRLAMAAVIAAGLLAGYWLARLPVFGVAAEHISYPAVLIGAAWALRIRAYLFGSRLARQADFTWLAGSLIPAGAVLVFFAFTARFFDGGLDLIVGAPGWTGIGAVLIAAADSLAIVAAVTIAMAALCFSRDWKKALRDLAVQLFVFKLTVWVMVLLLVDIGIVGPVVGSIVEGIFGIDLPDWLGDFIDQLSYAALMSLIYVAVIGATWTVCRQRFGELLAHGEVDIVASVAALARGAAPEPPGPDDPPVPPAADAKTPKD